MITNDNGKTENKLHRKQTLKSRKVCNLKPIATKRI